jgi:L-fuconolactonase
MQNFIQRRNLIQAGLVTGLSLFAGQSFAAEEAPLIPVPVVDTHLHLWDLERFKLPWIGEKHPLRRNYSLADYQQEIAGLNIVQSLYMEVAVAPEQQRDEVKSLATLCQENKQHVPVAIVGGPIAKPEFRDYLQELTKLDYVRGVRAPIALVTADDKTKQHKPWTAVNDQMLDPTVIQNVQALGQAKLTFDINVPPAQLPFAVALADAAPETTLILDHCGNVSVTGTDAEWKAWQTQTAALAQRKNVTVKLSGFLANIPKDRELPHDKIKAVIEHLLREFGPERAVFGSDWPVCTKRVSIREWLTLLYYLISKRPEAEVRAILAENARRVYRLPAS